MNGRPTQATQDRAVLSFTAQTVPLEAHRGQGTGLHRLPARHLIPCHRSPRAVQMEDTGATTCPAVGPWTGYDWGVDFEGRGCSAPPNSPSPSPGKSLQQMAALTEATRGVKGGPGESKAAPERSFPTTTVQRAVRAGRSHPTAGPLRAGRRSCRAPSFPAATSLRSLRLTMATRPRLNSHFAGGETEARGGSSPWGSRQRSLTAAQTHSPWAPFPGAALQLTWHPVLRTCRWRQSPVGSEAGWYKGRGLGAWSPAAQLPPQPFHSEATETLSFLKHTMERMAARPRPSTSYKIPHPAVSHPEAALRREMSSPAFHKEIRSGRTAPSAEAAETFVSINHRGRLQLEPCAPEMNGKSAT